MWRIALSACLIAIACNARSQSAKVTYYYTDPQGTPIVEADANANIISTSEYRPFGSAVSGGFSSEIGYTGHFYDADAGLVYMQARYYDPEMGRFLSTDHVPGSPGDLFSMGRYTYVKDNPSTLIDPSGNYSCDTKNEKSNCREVKKGRDRLNNLARSYSSHSTEGKRLNSILNALGTENDGNNVSVVFGTIGGGANGQTSFNPNAGILMKLDPAAISRNFGGMNTSEFVGTLAHEGQHAVDETRWKSNPLSPQMSYETEFNAFQAQSYVNEGFRTNSPYGVWDTSWPAGVASGMADLNADLLARCAAYGTPTCASP
jgi:RHS repeat-associated protein